MFWVTRKATGNVVGRNVSEESLELFLSVLPTGVYAIENSDGSELNLATVKRGRVEFKDCYGPRPEATILSTGTVVTVG
jgi:hypothetical protein